MFLNCKNCHKINLLPIISNLQPFRFQAFSSATNEKLSSHQQEWNNAKPSEEIPPKDSFFMIFSFLPGGKYYKMDPVTLMMAFKEKIGPITRFKGIFGKRDAVNTHNPEDFVTVLRNEGIWPSRPALQAMQYHRQVHRADFFQDVGDLLTADGEKWANFRSVVNPVLMQPKNVKIYMHKMSQVNKEFIESLEVEMNPLWKYYKTKSFKTLMTCLDSVTNITNFYINEAIERLEREQKEGKPEKQENEKSVLEKLLKIDRKIAKIMAMDMLMAGVDTTTSALVGVLLCLAQNPSKQTILREEILKILPHKDSEFKAETLKTMPYLRACIKEALRIYPITLGIGRVTTNDVILSGYRVPKGTQISLIPIALVNDEKLFPRPQEFLPERWLRVEKKACDHETQVACPASLKTSNPFVFLPFGFGPRSCVGRRIVEMELELGIARIIRNFYVEYNYPMENAFKCLLINVPNIPLTFKFSEVEK